MSEDKIRVRIAPSPSGNLHIGTARTALFNYLFAKKTGGEYVLRIEDTDLDRSSEAYKQNIFDSLKALGLNWDEGPDVGGPYGPYKQSERFDIYPKYAQMLIDKGYAYECFCSNEDLDEEHRIAEEKKIPYKYSRKCLNLTKEQKDELKAKGIKPSIRFKVDAKELIFNDLVKGELKFDTGLIGDFAIMKSNGTPTYNFAVVIDDMLMKISHVIRGEDHISNTPKQILIYEALGAPVPKFGHLGMILAPDRSKLSKRHGATAVSDFIKEGYLTEALLNFVALLGWAPSDGVEIKNVDEIAADFRINEVSSSNSIFEYEKLNWMNGQYIKHMDISKLTDLAIPFLNMYDLNKYSRKQLEHIIEVTREPITLLKDLVNDTQYFFEEPKYDEVEEILKGDVAKLVLPKFKNDVETYDFNNEEDIHDKLADLRTYFKENHGFKPKETMWAIRSALPGRKRGADMVATIQILGKDEVQKRLEKLI